MAERSILAVPGSDERMHIRALASVADGLFLDLEDSVAAINKPKARQQVVETIRTGEWGSRLRRVRINALDTPWWYEDLIEVCNGSQELLDTVILPKVNAAADVQIVAGVLTRIERQNHLGISIKIEAQIETARGLVEIEQIAGSSARLTALVFGPGDFAASMGVPGTNVGLFDEWDMAYGGHRWHDVMMRILAAARANGLAAIDGPFADFQDSAGLRRSSMVARALGYDGKWCIHPGQLAIVNEIFAPTPDETEWAKQVVLAWESGLINGRGAVAQQGQMLDAASFRLATNVLSRANNLQSKADRH